MLPSLRSTVVRSLPRQARLFSGQLNANEAEIQKLMGTKSASISPVPTPTPGPPTTPKMPQLPIESPPRDPLLDLIASRLMRHGKRARATKITSEILLHINALTKAPPLPIVRQAVELAAPAVKVMRHKRAAKVIVKPFALNERQRTRIAIDWIRTACLLGPEHTLAERMAREFIKIVQGQSSVLENKADLHRLAMVSRGNLPRLPSK